MDERNSVVDYKEFADEQIKTITKTLTKVMFGDFTQVAQTTKPDESFGYLCIMINVAINAARNAQNDLKHLNNELERVVRKRTSDLDTANKYLIKELHERKRVETVLAEAKVYTESIFRSMADILIVTNPDGTIKTVNQAALDLLGYEYEELTGQPVQEIFAAAATVTLFAENQIAKLIIQSPIKNSEMTTISKNGEKIPMSLSGSVMRDSEDKISGIVMVARDLRETRKLISATATAVAERGKAEALEKINLELREKTEELERFHNLAVGREERMIDLKKEINHILAKQGQSEKYAPLQKIEERIDRDEDT